LFVQRKNQRKGATNEKSIISFPCRPLPEPGPDMIDFTPFVDLPAHLHLHYAINIENIFWISTGLREFWEIATVLRLAASAYCKQYCLRSTPREVEEDDELYCVGKLKNRSPKIICSLEFSLVTFFVSRQRK
jgi:hypothetical protein